MKSRRMEIALYIVSFIVTVFLIMLALSYNWTTLISLASIAYLLFFVKRYKEILYQETPLVKEKDEQIAKLQLQITELESADKDERVEIAKKHFGEIADRYAMQRDKALDEKNDLKIELLKKEEQLHYMTVFLSAIVDKMDGRTYERFVGYKLESMGWTDIRYTKASGDYGADIIGVDPDGETVAIQCKHYTGVPVGVKAVQEALSGKAYYDCDRAMVITTNGFTPNAEDLADTTGTELMPYFK